MEDSEKLQCLMDITQIEDAEFCRQILEAHDWNVERAVNAALPGGDVAPPEPTTLAQAAPPSRAISPEPNLNPIPNPLPVAPPPRVAGIQIPAFLNTPVAIVRLMSNAVGSMFGLGFMVVGEVLRMLFPQRMRRGLSGTINRFTSGYPTPDPVASAEEFVSNFRAAYGYTHPAFERSSYKDALKKAQQQFKFLVVYLHAPEHQDTPKFCRETLCSAAVTDFMSENFLAWGGDIRSADAFQLSSVLQASTYPFVAVLANMDSRAILIGADEGPGITPERLLNLLAQVLENRGPDMVAARADEEERDANRRLRAEQDAEFEASLAADREREDRRRAEQERLEREKAEQELIAANEAKAQAEQEARARELETALEKRRQEKAAALSEEPAAGPTVSQVALRLPDGSRTQRRFHSTCVVQDIYDFVDTLDNLGCHKYSLLTNFPKKVFDEATLKQTLVEAGLHPQAMLFVLSEDD